MRFFLMVSILFLSFSSTTYADVIDPEDSGSTTEESEEKTEEEGGCSNVNMSDLSLIMLPVIGLAVASRRR